MASMQPDRPWFQFSLRTLLIVLTLFCVTVGWVGYRVQRAWVNRDRLLADEKTVRTAIEEPSKEVAVIEEFGGEVAPHYINSRPPTWLEQLFDDPGGPDDPVVSWSFSVEGSGDFGDAGLESLKGLPKLTVLDLNDTQVTDAGLEHLIGLQALRVLILNRTNVTDAGLEHLKGLTNLQILWLGTTETTYRGGSSRRPLKGLEVTDAGLEHLKGLQSLQSLDLTATNVTDAGLEHLTGLSSLEELRLSFTEVSDEGVKKLQQALPNCTIQR